MGVQCRLGDGNDGCGGMGSNGWVWGKGWVGKRRWWGLSRVGVKVGGPLRLELCFQLGSSPALSARSSLLRFGCQPDFARMRIRANRWKRRLCVWKQRFPWLTLKQKDGVHMFGCKVCSQAGSRTKLGRVMLPSSSAQKCDFVQHEATKCHKVASSSGAACAPTKKQFKKVLLLVQKGQCPDGIVGIGRRKKIRKMKFCLAEATRVLRMNKLRSCEVLSLHADARKGRLAVRFTGSTRGLELQSGVLGTVSLVKSFSSDALGVSKAVKEVVKLACTSYSSIPFNSRQIKAKLDKKLHRHVRTCVELLNADAAVDEQLAGKLNSKKIQGCQPYLPNVKIRNKDKAHASRRITSRTWSLALDVFSGAV